MLINIDFKKIKFAIEKTFNNFFMKIITNFKMQEGFKFIIIILNLILYIENIEKKLQHHILTSDD